MIHGARIRYFPGLPVLTCTVKARLKQALSGAVLYLEEDSQAALRYERDIRAYQVFINDHKIGRFTIRRSDTFIERNFFCLLPIGTTLPDDAVEQGCFGVASLFYYDPIRIAWEYLLVALRAVAEYQPVEHDN